MADFDPFYNVCRSGERDWTFRFDLTLREHVILITGAYGVRLTGKSREQTQKRVEQLLPDADEAIIVAFDAMFRFGMQTLSHDAPGEASEVWQVVEARLTQLYAGASTTYAASTLRRARIVHG